MENNATPLAKFLISKYSLGKKWSVAFKCNSVFSWKTMTDKRWLFRYGYFLRMNEIYDFRESNWQYKADYKVIPPRENIFLWKCVCAKMSSTAFPILKDISDEMGDVKWCNFLNVA